MGSISTGLLMTKRTASDVVYFLVHPGGPFFQKKDNGFWTIPKGLINQDEDGLSAAIREFEEETSLAPKPPYYPLGEIKQKGGKMVQAWSFWCPKEYTDWDPELMKSNTFTMEWPPKSGMVRSFPEVDKGCWFNYEQAINKINIAQVPFLERALVLMD